MLKLVAGKVGYGVVCLFAAVLLVVAGYAHKVVGQVTATEKGIAIKGSTTLGATAKSLTSLAKDHVEVLLGTGATVVPSGLAPASSTPTAPSAPASTSAGNNGAAGGAVTVAAQAKYGIPCVY